MQRQTKIIATLGPAVASEEGVRSLVEAGVDVARLNFSHGTHEFHRECLNWVRSVSKETGRAVAVMQDIQGPKIRVGEFPGGAIELTEGMEIELAPSGAAKSDGAIAIGYEALLDDVDLGHRVLLADGMVALKVVGHGQSTLVAECVDAGTVADNKGVAFPDSNLSAVSITSKDEADLAFGVELGVDYVAASFVRTAKDVEAVKDLSGDAPVIAKIELAQAYANLDEILDVAFGVMVARGDLGVQLPLDQIPLIQSDILDRASSAGRISVTATEMLESMTHSPRPTRAEVTDVANAVTGGTDAVMLSGETAIGEYPAQSVEAMARICLTIEEGTLSSRGKHPVSFVDDKNYIASAVAQGATEIAKNVEAETIVAFTESGNTARLISKYRPEQRVVAFTPNPKTLNRMALYWGVVPHDLDRREYTDDEIALAARILREEGISRIGETVVMVAGVPPSRRASTNLVKVHRIGELAGGLGS